MRRGQPLPAASWEVLVFGGELENFDVDGTEVPGGYTASTLRLLVGEGGPERVDTLRGVGAPAARGWTALPLGARHCSQHQAGGCFFLQALWPWCLTYIGARPGLTSICEVPCICDPAGNAVRCLEQLSSQRTGVAA